MNHYTKQTSVLIHVKLLGQLSFGVIQNELNLKRFGTKTLITRNYQEKQLGISPKVIPEALKGQLHLIFKLYTLSFNWMPEVRKWYAF